MAPSTAAPTQGRTREAVRGATPLALAGLVANGANVLVTLVIARALPTRSYGALAQLLAVFFVVSMPGSALLVGVVRRVTGWQRAGQLARAAAWATRIRRAGLAVVAAVVGTALLSRRLIADELSLPGPGGVVEVLAAGAAWGLLCVDRGLLQSARAYPGLAANLLVEGLLRGTLTVGLVVAGLGVEGAALALLLCVVAADAHARWLLHGRVGPPRAGGPVAANEDTAGLPAQGPPVPPAPPVAHRRSLAADVGAAFGALALLGFLQNVDVIVLGRQAPEQAGAYAAVSVASKALVFAAVVLSSFLLPEAADRRHLGQHALHQLGGTLAILAVPAGLLVTLALVGPGELLRIAFGARLTGAAPALLPLATAMACLGCAVLFTHYLLAVGQRRVLVALAAAAAAALPLLGAAGGDPLATARADLACQALLAVVTGLLVLQAARQAGRTRHPAACAAPMREDRSA